MNELPEEVVEYIYSFLPIYHINKLKEKYNYEYSFLDKILAEDFSSEGRIRKQIWKLFYKYFPDSFLFKLHYETVVVKDFDGNLVYSYNEDYTDYDDLISEIIEQLNKLEEDESNHYNLYKLHMAYIHFPSFRRLH